MLYELIFSRDNIVLLLAVMIFCNAIYLPMLIRNYVVIKGKRQKMVIALKDKAGFVSEMQKRNCRIQAIRSSNMMQMEA